MNKKVERNDKAKEREIPIDNNINKSINSEKQKSINIKISQSQSNYETQKRSHSVSNIKTIKRSSTERNKSKDANTFKINLQDIIKEVALLKTDSKIEKTKHKIIKSEYNNKSIDIDVKDSSTKTKESYLHHSMKKLKTEEDISKKRSRTKDLKLNNSNKRITPTKNNDKEKDKNITDNIYNTQQITPNNSNVNHFNTFHSAIKDFNQMKLSNVYKAHKMIGNLLDYMMIFKQRVCTHSQSREKNNKPIVILNPNKDKPMCIPKNNHNRSNSKSRDDHKAEDFKKTINKAFHPLNIAEIYIERKNDIIESILGNKEYSKLMKANTLIESNIDKNDNNDFKQSDVYNKNQHDSAYLHYNLTDHNTQINPQKSQSYFEKYSTIESKLKAT